jgi:hypothetical protein
LSEELREIRIKKAVKALKVMLEDEEGNVPPQTVKKLKC